MFDISEQLQQLENEIDAHVVTKRVASILLCLLPLLATTHNLILLPRSKGEAGAPAMLQELTHMDRITQLQNEIEQVQKQFLCPQKYRTC